MLIYSHRGESKYAPENTMSAFYLAYLLNSDGIECDIRKTKDNKLVLIHDKKIDRTSNFKGEVSSFTMDQLHNFDFGNKNYKNEGIVSLDEFLKYFSNKNINIFLEIKESGYEDLIYKTLSKYNMSNITIISFKYDILKKMREQSSFIKLGWLVYAINSKVIEDAINIDINLLLCNSISLDKNSILLLNNTGIQIGAWGIKTKAELKRINKLAVDVIVYDSYYDAKKELHE